MNMTQSLWIYECHTNNTLKITFPILGLYSLKAGVDCNLNCTYNPSKYITGCDQHRNTITS